MKPRIKSLIFLSTPVILVLVASIILQASVISNPEIVAKWLSSFGPFVVVVYAVIQIIAIVFAPLSGFFLQVAAFAVFGPLKGLLLIYLVCTPAFLINFFIARKYGRPLVERLVGKGALKTIDHIAFDAGTFTLIILKVFQGGIFDYVSYAVGLTQIPFKTFFIVNLFGGIPGAFVSYYILTSSSNFTQNIIILLVVAYVLAGVSILTQHRIKKHKRSKAKKQ